MVSEKNNKLHLRLFFSPFLNFHFASFCLLMLLLAFTDTSLHDVPKSTEFVVKKMDVGGAVSTVILLDSPEDEEVSFPNDPRRNICSKEDVVSAANSGTTLRRADKKPVTSNEASAHTDAATAAEVCCPRSISAVTSIYSVLAKASSSAIELEKLDWSQQSSALAPVAAEKRTPDLLNSLVEGSRKDSAIPMPSQSLAVAEEDAIPISPAGKGRQNMVLRHLRLFACIRTFL